MAVSKAVKLLDRILDAGYPEGTAKKIASGQLSMDEASRISRASEQATNTNRELYHWTNREFSEFQPSSGGKFGQGVYLSPRPYYGEKYVRGGDPLRMSVFGPSNIANREDIASVERVVLNEMKELGVPPMAMGDTFWNLTQEKLKEKGFDALEFGDEVVVFDPARVRDVRAAFDPDNKGLKNILGGSAALAIGLGASGESEAGIPDAAAKAVNKAVNVRVDKKAGIDYADEILSGNKTFETRNTDSLRPYVGQRVGIARTGAGEAKALGSAEIGEPIVVDEATFRTMQDQHLVPPGTDFDIKPGGTKYLYPVSNPERFDTPKSVGHGIVSRKILGGGTGAAVGLSASDTSQAAVEQLNSIMEGRLTPGFKSRATQAQQVISGKAPINSTQQVVYDTMAAAADPNPDVGSITGVPNNPISQGAGNLGFALQNFGSNMQSAGPAGWMVGTAIEDLGNIATRAAYGESKATDPAMAVLDFLALTPGSYMSQGMRTAMADKDIAPMIFRELLK